MRSKLLHFPVKTTKANHTPIRHIRMDDALHGDMVALGKETSIGNLSATVRFACQELLRSRRALQTVTPQPPVKVAR